MTYNKFDVFFARVKFEDSSTFQDRPVIIIKDLGESVLCLKGTTNLNTPVKNQKIQMLPEAGLHNETTIVLKNYIKIPKQLLRVKTGHLDIYDIVALQVNLDNYKKEIGVQEKLHLNESLFEEYNSNDNEQLYKKIASQVRKEMVDKCGKDFLYGKCIEASEKIVDLLSKKGVNSSAVEGWVHYDCDEGCTDRDYDEHTWVETEDGYIIDATATQFNNFMDEDYPDIIISKELPYGYSYDEPDGYLDDYSDEEWFYKNLIEELSNIEYRPISNINKFKKYADEILGGYGGMSDSDIKRDIEEIYIDGELKGYIGLSKYNEEDGTKLLGIGNFMIIERGKGYGTQVINNIVSKYKSEYDLIYCFVDSDNEGAISLYKRLGKVYDEDGPNDNGQYYVTFYDNGKYKLEENLTEARKKNKKKKISQVNPGEAIFKSVKDMQKWVKKRQKGMGYFVHMDCGNMDYNNDMFNKMHGMTDASSGSTTDGGVSDAAPSGGEAGVGMGESLEITPLKKELKDYLTTREIRFIKSNQNLLNNQDWIQFTQELNDAFLYKENMYVIVDFLKEFLPHIDFTELEQLINVLE